MAIMLGGWIDNLEDLSSTLGVKGTPEQIYGAAVERWGADADKHVVGQYASLVTLPDGAVRMARSPWAGYPLFYHLGPHGMAACSILRPLFAAGLPKQLRPTVVAKLVTLERTDDADAGFEGLQQVPGGSVVTLTRGGAKAQPFYSPASITTLRLRRDEDYVDAANALLAEAVGKALKLSRKPAVTLSGGLDSSIVCDEMTRQLPAGSGLKAITFEPMAAWDGRAIPGLFGSDRPYVEEFLRCHPGLDHQFVDNSEYNFLSFSDAAFLASDRGHPMSVLGQVGFGVAQAARDAGCDWVFSAGLGNLTFSNEAPWAPAEFFRTLRWKELWQRSASRVADPRPVWRRALATGVMPNLPPRLRWALRDLVHRGRPPEVSTNPYLAKEGPLADKLSSRHIARSAADMDFFHSRDRLTNEIYDLLRFGGESGVGMQQVNGLQGRDVLAYRPFIEFCLSLPTRQFVRGGEGRYLARRMAIGRLPDAQRTERRHGDHIADWHARLTPMLPQLREEVRQIAEHPELGQMLDVQAMLHDLDNWPTVAPTDIQTVSRLRFALPAMCYVRRYVDYVSGRNPQ